MFRPWTLLATHILVASSAFGQSTVFTYQGRLQDAGAPAEGLYDLTFRLFGAGSGGSQIGPTVCVNNVLVTEGLFTATLDFGQQYAATGDRFLEIEVRADAGLDCTNGAGFTVLAPRAPLAPVPLAAHAHGAFALDAPDGSPPNAVFVDNSGRVGIGTTSPTHPLHLAANVPILNVQDSDSTGAQQSGYVRFADRDNSERGWVGFGDQTSTDLSLVNNHPTGNTRLAAGAADHVMLSSSGNVGIGTTNPAVKLDVRGDVRLGPFGQYRAAAGGENLRIIRGVIDWTGAITSGLGFGVSHTSTGQYNVGFTIPFSGTPSVTATVMETPSVSLNTAFAMTQGVTASGVNLEVLDRSNGGFVNRIVQFIAIGPR